MEADARTLGQGVALDETKPRVETRPIASESALMKAIQTLDLKFWTMFIMMIGMYVTTIVGIITIINTTNERLDTLETNLIMRIDGTNERIDSTNERLDTLETNLIMRLDATNKRIDTLGSNLNARIDMLGSDLNARIDMLGSDLNGRLDGTNERIDKLQ